MSHNPLAAGPYEPGLSKIHAVYRPRYRLTAAKNPPTSVSSKVEWQPREMADVTDARPSRPPALRAQHVVGAVGSRGRLLLGLEPAVSPHPLRRARRPPVRARADSSASARLGAGGGEDHSFAGLRGHDCRHFVAGGA